MIGCAEDKGNYNYKELNDIAITLNPVTEDGSGVDVMFNQEYKIEPALERALENSEDGLSFEWTVGDEVMSTERNLEMVISDKWAFGLKKGRLSVTDNNTGMKYFSSFSFNIVNSFSMGHYMLCRKADNSSILYYLKEVIEVVKDANDKPTGETIIKEPVIVSTSMIGDLEIGDDPADLVSNYGTNSNVDAETWTLNILTKGEGKNLINTNLVDFLPSLYIDSKSFADASKNYKFNPVAMGVTGRADVVYLSNGQIISQIENKLYRPSKLYPQYDFSKLYIGDVSMTFFAYDSKSDKCYYLNFGEDPSAYDAVIEPENAPSYAGKNIIGFTFDKYNSDDYLESEEYIFCMVASNNEVIIDRYTNWEKWAPDWGSFEKRVFCDELYKMSIPNVSSKSKIVLSNKDWYISTSNIVYLSSFDIPNAKPLYTIPAELGEIKDIKISVKGDKLVIACYNAQSSEEKKGSLVVMTLQTKKTNIYKFFMDETVVLNCCDEAQW